MFLNFINLIIFNILVNNPYKKKIFFTNLHELVKNIINLNEFNIELTLELYKDIQKTNYTIFNILALDLIIGENLNIYLLGINNKPKLLRESYKYLG